ncbi:MAG: putative cofD-like protein [Patiriisocius sp.]|jgi:uncharacterized cofD-like protein
MDRKKVVVIGGGTGIYPLLKGLKTYKDVDVTAVITMADAGGSTGRLRDEFGQLPVGDVRMALAALSAEVDNHDELLRELFLYRFDKGEGLNGHNLGNLLLVALTDMLGSESEAIKVASRILRVRGTVLPVTEDRIHIVATYDDGVEIEGEHDIDEPAPDRFKNRITALRTVPPAHITKDAHTALEQADMIVLGPGDLYTSLLANCVVNGVPAAIQSSRAQFVFVTNLMSSQGQTYGMTAKGHADEVLKYVGRAPDTILVNTGKVSDVLLQRYATACQFPIVDDADEVACKIVRADLLDDTEFVQKKGDTLQRSLVRGDSTKMAQALYGLL